MYLNAVCARCSREIEVYMNTARNKFVAFPCSCTDASRRARRWLSLLELGVFLIVAAVLLTSCTTAHLELGAGYDKYIEQGTNPRALFRVTTERECGIAVTCFAEFDHHSSFRDGYPFNSNAEVLTNQWSVGVRVKLWGAR